MKIGKKTISIFLTVIMVVCLMPKLESNAATTIRELVKPTWEFSNVNNFQDGMACVSNKDRKYGYVDKSGKIAIPLKYDYAESFMEGMAVVSVGAGDNGYVVVGGKWGYIDTSGKEVIPLTYEMAKPFNEGFAAVKKDGKMGFIDKKGKVTVPIVYDDTNYFSGGLASVGKEGKEGVVDTAGNVKIPFIYDWIGSFMYEDTTAVAGKDGKSGIINNQGEVVIPFEYDAISSFNGENITYARKNEEVMYIDRTGAIVPEPADKNELSFSEGFVAVEKDGKWGFVNKSGNTVIAPKYDRVGEFSYGIAAAQKSGKWGYIDTAGNELTQLIYDEAWPISENIGWVRIGTKWGLVQSYEGTPQLSHATAVPTTQNVLVDGKKVDFDAYNIGGSNYFKIRDLAYALKDTTATFEVGWDGAQNAINLSNGKSYTLAGGEMTKGIAGNKTATPTNSKIYLDGNEVKLTVFIINGSSYFRLVDVGEALGFGVVWDEATKTVNVNSSK